MPFLISLLTVIATAGTQTTPSAPIAATPTPRDALLSRVVVLGASVSDGFGLEGELEVPASFSVFLDAAWTIPHAPATSYASGRFFMDPVTEGARQRDAALVDEVSLLCAVDYLFWFGYGVQASPEARLARLEKGLAMLDEIGGPMLVGDFPDMRPALAGKGLFGGPMISPAQIPAAETLVQLNARVDAWAKERPHVIRVPLAFFVTRLQSHEALEVRGQKWSPKDSERLLQEDLLHATLEGTSALTILVMDVLERGRDEIAATDVQWKATEIVSGVQAATEGARVKKREKAAKRVERMRKLEERKREREAEKQKQDQVEDTQGERNAA